MNSDSRGGALRKGMAALAAAASMSLVPAGVHAQDSQSSSPTLQSWSTQLTADQRFVVLDAFNGEAVLDRETQLVWERTVAPDALQWPDGQQACYLKTVGGRMGWRLPAIQELASLVDPNEIDPTTPKPALPAGHPFEISTGLTLWSTTSKPLGGTSAGTGLGTEAYALTVDSGAVGPASKSSTASPIAAWCVRGFDGAGSE